MFRTTRLLMEAAATIEQQSELIVRQHLEAKASELAYMRISRDLIEQFLIALDLPETHDEIRQRLATSLGFYNDEIAVREEHVS